MNGIIEEIDITAIRPATGLTESTGLLQDRELLNRRYEEDGYLYFRGVVPREISEAARLRMAQALVDEGLAESTGADAKWIGGDRPHPSEESVSFAGICAMLFEAPNVAAKFEQLLGEPISLVPNTMYRAYKPNNKPGPIHQDGPYNPGCEGYRSLWIALCDIDAKVGGMTIAPGCHTGGSLHHSSAGGKIPKGAVPDDGWRREDYRQGDVLVIHGMMPHGGLPNRSDRIRYSIDTRVQSAANPTVIQGTMTQATREAVSMLHDDGKTIRLSLNKASMLRFGPSGTPISLEAFLELNPEGMRVMATRAGGIALMLRHACPG